MNPFEKTEGKYNKSANNEFKIYPKTFNNINLCLALLRLRSKFLWFAVRKIYLPDISGFRT